MRSTHTYVELELSHEAYNEIAVKMRAAGYDHVFGMGGRIYMEGIAVTPAPQATAVNPELQYRREK